MALKLIKDGYTKDGVFSEPGLELEDVHFKYRPALPEAAYEFYVRVKDSGKEYMKCLVELLLPRLVKWDIEDEIIDTPGAAPRTGVAIIDETTIRQVPRPVLDCIVQHVAGYAPAQARKDQKN